MAGKCGKSRPFCKQCKGCSVRIADNQFEKISLVNNMAMRAQIPLYLFIDEYDNFTNVVLNEQGEEIYHQLTHASGFYRDIFKLFKGMFERNIQGFFLAYLNLNDYYITAPEVEIQHGYCDFFLLPNLTHYQSRHSYILEIKYLPKKDFETKSEQQWQEAVAQIEGYAAAPRVESLRKGTELHKIVMQFCGWELARIEEV